MKGEGRSGDENLNSPKSCNMTAGLLDSSRRQCWNIFFSLLVFFFDYFFISIFIFVFCSFFLLFSVRQSRYSKPVTVYMNSFVSAFIFFDSVIQALIHD